MAGVGGITTGSVGDTVIEESELVSPGNFWAIASDSVVAVLAGFMEGFT